MATKQKTYCEEPGCDKGPFKGQHGLAVHHIRAHQKNWTGQKKKRQYRRSTPTVSGAEMIRHALAEAGRPMSTAEIAEVIETAGFRSRSKTASIHNYVGQTASGDHSIKRVARGMYALKADAVDTALATAAPPALLTPHVTKSTVEAVDEREAMTKEALLVMVHEQGREIDRKTAAITMLQSTISALLR